jgi:hypothetical protein
MKFWNANQMMIPILHVETFSFGYIFPAHNCNKTHFLAIRNNSRYAFYAVLGIELAHEFDGFFHDETAIILQSWINLICIQMNECKYITAPQPSIISLLATVIL